MVLCGHAKPLPVLCLGLHYAPVAVAPASSHIWAGIRGQRVSRSWQVTRGVAEGLQWRYCSVSESCRMRSSSSSSWRTRLRRSSCSCADSSMASRSCSS